MEKIESGTEIVEETGNYLGLNLIRAPKNHESIEQMGKPFVQWYKKHRVRPEIYYLSSTTSEQENAPEGLESIAKTLSIKDDKEEVGSCCNSIETELMQMKSLQR